MTTTWTLIDATPLTPSEVSICNRALMHVGVSALIESLTESTPESRACRVAYGSARDELLALHGWKFASKTVALVPAVDEPTRPGWRFVYALPADLLHPLGLWAGARVVTEGVPYELEHGNEGQVLVTDQAEAVLHYVARVPNAERFPPLFAAAVARRMAIDLVSVLPVRPELVGGLAGLAALALSQARTADLRMATRDKPPESPTITARQ